MGPSHTGRVSSLAFGLNACYSKRMEDDPPVITIDDDDPRYLQFLEEQAEDRRRWAASPQAKAEMERLRDRSWKRPDWQPVEKKEPYRQRVYVWDKTKT